MNRPISVTVVVDNTVRDPALLAEHGLSFYVESEEQKILFDTGQGKVWQQNLEILGIDLAQVDSIVLSHGHYDHTGGLVAVLGQLGHASVYMHPAALAGKYSRRRQPPHQNIGTKTADESVLRSKIGRLLWTQEPTKIGQGVFVTGEIPRHTTYEDVGGAFYLDETCTRPDPLLDDQAMYIETGHGLVVLLGCAHAGVVNTLDYIAELTGRGDVYAVVGGMHLVKASTERLRATVENLARRNVQVLAPAHCTGAKATAMLWSELPQAWRECGAGVRFEFGNS